jgi:hypothetical protein
MNGRTQLLPKARIVLIYFSCSGNNDQAVINDSNAKDHTVGAASGVKKAVQEDGISLPIQTVGPASRYRSAESYWSKPIIGNPRVYQL